MCFHYSLGVSDNLYTEDYLEILLMKNFTPLGTLIHGIGASEHIDSSGERISIKGLDISSLERDGVFNWEHKNDNSAHIVGKVLKAKKIFSQEDCETPEELYFWQKAQAPYIYVMGELFDGVGHKGAQEIAAMLKYDSLARKQNRSGMNTINFSVEGSKLNKEGQEITKSLARKITITTAACNKVAVAEILAPSKSSKEDSILDFAKSEESGVEILEKNTKLLQTPNISQNPFGNKIGQTKSGKDIFQSAKPMDYKEWSADDHHDAMNVHINATSGKDFKTANRHRLMAQWHGQARDRMAAKMKAIPKTPSPSPSSASGKSTTAYHPDLSGKVNYMKKTLTAGSAMSAPSALTGGAALASQDFGKKLEKLSNYPKIYKFISGKYPDMTKDEAEAMAKYMAARQMIRAEEVLEKMYDPDMDKSKNVREQRKKIFGTDPNAPRISDKRRKMMQRIRDFSEKRFGMPMITAEGKRDTSGKMREDKDNQPAYDVFTPEGAAKEKALLEQYKEKKIKRTDPKPDWKSGRLETQPSPDAAVHEAAHLYLAPEGMTPGMFQEEMDRLWGESQSKYGHMQQKKTSGEIQPMSIENPIRRELGFPANRTTKPVKQNEPALDYEGMRFVEGKDPKGRKVFYDRQSRLSTPETKERVQEIQEGSLKFHPEIGWFKESSPDALINLRGRGKTEEAKVRAQQRYAQDVKPKKMAASEMASLRKAGSLYKRCWEGYKPVPGKKPYSKGSCEKK